MRSCSVSCMVASLRASCASDCGRSARCGGRDELSRHSLHPFHPSSRHAQIVLYARTPVKTALDPRKQLPLAPGRHGRNTTRSLLASCRAVCAVSLAARQLTPPQMRDRRRDRWQQRAPPEPAAEKRIFARCAGYRDERTTLLRNLRRAGCEEREDSAREPKRFGRIRRCARARFAELRARGRAESCEFARRVGGIFG